MSELKPCPFCGSDAEYYDNVESQEVACSDTNCTYLISVPDGMESAFLRWNTRHTPEITITDEMIDAGAEAYHDAKIEAEARYVIRHAGRECRDYVCFPDHWLRQVFEAMIKASKEK